LVIDLLVLLLDVLQLDPQALIDASLVVGEGRPLLMALLAQGRHAVNLTKVLRQQVGETVRPSGYVLTKTLSAKGLLL
jgi:hypothetical protein